MNQPGFGEASASPIAVIDCGVNLDIARADRLCRVLRRHLIVAEPVLLDTRTVQAVDYAGLHLLRTFLEIAAERRLEVYWPDPGPCLSEAAALLRLMPPRA